VRQSFDAIVVGLGAAGGIIATELAGAGYKVLGLEKGAYYTQADFRKKFDEVRFYCRSAILPHMATDPITWRPNASQDAVVLPWASNKLGLGNPFEIPPSIGTGGGTVHWGAACFRHRAQDFRMRSAIVERFSVHVLPEGSNLVDWPLDYHHLEPYYDRVEWDLGIAGCAGNIRGEIQADGNPFEAPRSRGYPMPPLDRAAADRLFAEASRRLGYHPFPTPAAIATVPFQGRAACTNCGFCHGYPCHVGAKISTHEILRSAASKYPDFEIRAHSRVFRVNKRLEGSVKGVSYFDAEGKIIDVEAPLVVLSCYAFENARLLLVSDLNQSGQVGQNLMLHNYGWFTGVMPIETNSFMGSLQCGSVIDDLTSELIPDNAEGVLWGSPINTWTGDLQPIEVAHGVPAHVPRWGLGFKRWMAENFRRLLKLYTQHSTFPSRAVFCDLDSNITDAFGQPALRITHEWTEYDRKAVQYFMQFKRQLAEELGMLECWEDSPTPAYHVTVHDAGTHRMGDDPRTSVVDRFGAVHKCRGLFAVGGGQFPTLPAYNPTQTIMALAYFTADHIVGKA
jgi:gluconate 2-dehydrogenase alpha chain